LILFPAAYFNSILGLLAANFKPSFGGNSSGVPSLSFDTQNKPPFKYTYDPAVDEFFVEVKVAVDNSEPQIAMEVNVHPLVLTQNS